ncbi:MAG: response regulator transcription factor [Nitriliruptor sp.]|uniref:response regulator n=1 Tax=Nitriliruptor sp. TaxID=2448056 RepID=UPI0034A086E0
MTIVEDHGLIAQTVAAALTARGTAVAVIDPAHTNDDLFDAVTATEPDLVLLDLDFGGGRTGLPLVEPLAAADVRVVMVTGVSDPVRRAECVAAGAIGVLSKSGSFDELVGAIERAVDQGTLLSPAERNDHLALLREHRDGERRRSAPFEALTQREAEVLGQLMHGRSVDEVARAAHVTVATVRTQVRAILTKLGVTSQLAATAKARDAGWDPPLAT